jgi:hypothetical protein
VELFLVVVVALIVGPWWARILPATRTEIDQWFLVQLIESVGRELGIANRMLNVLMPEEALD